jgi:hypothetical protein
MGANSPDFIPIEDGVRTGVIVAIVILLIFINVIIVYCFRRHSKREMQGEMQM